ncbi:hypothetical protein JW813_15260 [Clostridium botulinum]|uniref:Lin0368 family putative glycerol transporter subunit n=1 Tax=Clostridium botulinum TaxID=1491 RepID=UPI0013F0752F|nr:hypothetical protein [Clostridium botulinum]NFG25485.1 hypothetical protein [Clostridium botulinum]NFO04549.1 hypothetical protein [Clostridium botulinum]NFR13400.1 hypothetical protein [Clostridium botulinum]NFR42069.1 hypothetical protein [Clostridium botulinum]NFS50774.1 hypothetical protein [Clostridium botulinum]
MSTTMAIHTIVGGFMLPFLIRMTWGKLVEHFGGIGGWLAAAFVVGLTWCLNHGTALPLIHQSGSWVDQGFSVGIGLLTATIVLGGSFKKCIPNILQAITGGALAAFIASLVLAV